jgi:adenosyl cobinamide kinase/adenosyl cobinamide phosphate guanylyltransferase
MVRALSINNILKMKHSTFEFRPPWSLAFSESPSDSGFWLIWGREKNGKTWFALLLAKYLATLKKVLYISAEEGLGKEFVEAIKRANITTHDRNLQFVGNYLPLTDLRAVLDKRNAPEVVFIDNLTMYSDEMRQRDMMALMDDYPNILFVFIAHEERGEPYKAIAKLCRRLAKIIIHVQGLKANVSGRCTGGEYQIDEAKAQLFWGITTNEYDNN